MKKTLIIISLIILFILGVGGGAYVWNRSQSETKSPVSENTAKQTSSQKMLTWDDPAGFTFEYPEDVVVDKHDEDMENYAHVELTNSEYPGSIIVWAKDLPVNAKGVTVSTVDEWVVNDKELVLASSLDTVLGGEPAKKLLLTSVPKKQIVGTIYDEVLWYVEGEFSESDYWQETYDSLVRSFTFKPIGEEATTTSNSDGSATDYIEAVDEEEVIE